MFPDRLARLALTAAALALAGCATNLPRSAATKGADAAIATTPTKAAAPAPTPATDLWERIRRGLVLPAAGAQPQIREWTQFYASHRPHLRDSAERARPFLWHIVEALDAHGLPMELALLPIVESGFNPRAYSSSGAAGLWQFIPGTATRFGLERNWWYEGRLDALAATSAALDYLAWLHDRFGNWLLAVAAYNCGENCVGRELARVRLAGRPMDFWHLDLPAQTEDYVPKLLALKRLLLEPEKYALNWPRIPNRPVTTTVALPAQVELAVAAAMIGMPVGDLRDLNPAFRRWATHPELTRELLVPIATADKLRVALAAADPDQLVPTARPRHRVARGEALSVIARRYGTSVARIQQANDLAGTLIHPGDRLVIPVGPDAAATIDAPALVAEPHLARHQVARGQTLWGIARRYQVGVDDLRRWNDLATSTVLRPGQMLEIGPQGNAQLVYYRVRDGDTLWSIAHRYGVQVADLRAWNELDEVYIHPGQRLRILVTDAV